MKWEKFLEKTNYVEKAIEALEEDIQRIRIIKHQTPSICLASVKIDGDALYYVKEQTEEICIAAVKQNCTALQHVKIYNIDYLS